jgi:hypothetical protein
VISCRRLISGEPSRGAENPRRWGESRGDPWEALSKARARQLTPQARGADLRDRAHGGLSVFASRCFRRIRRSGRLPTRVCAVPRRAAASSGGSYLELPGARPDPRPCGGARSRSSRAARQPQAPARAHPHVPKRASGAAVTASRAPGSPTSARALRHRPLRSDSEAPVSHIRTAMSLPRPDAVVGRLTAARLLSPPSGLPGPAM